MTKRNLSTTRSSASANRISSPPAKRATRSSTRINSQQSQHQSLQVSSSSSSSAPASGSRSQLTGKSQLSSFTDRPSTKMRTDTPLDSDTYDNVTDAHSVDPFDGDSDHDDMMCAIVASLEENYPKPLNSVAGLPSPAPTNEVATQGRAGWKNDFAACRRDWGDRGEVEGYAGMVATVTGFGYGDADDSAKLQLLHEDIDGRATELNLEIVFQNLSKYPSSYNLVIYADGDVPRRALTTFARFTDIFDLDISSLLSQLVASLQGDDEASGGFAPDLEGEEYDGMEESETWSDGSVRPLQTSKSVDLTSEITLPKLKRHFEQALSFGYRPGLTRVSDFWVISYSIPLQNLSIDPNTLGIWDDGLVDAWKKDQRLILLMGVDDYPPRIDHIRYWMGLYQGYKPPLDLITATTRGQGLPGFFLSAPLLSYLKSFARCFKLRSAFNVNWATADSIGLDEERSRQIFQGDVVPTAIGPPEKDDPISKGFEDNVPLCAFHWVLRRFVEAPRYCLVTVPSLRPYVCDNPLCLYSFMSLGLGPSVEHTIITHPAVVDILLSFAHCAARTQTRMALPLNLHIEVPRNPEKSSQKGSPEVPSNDQYERSQEAKLLDELPEKLQRAAVVKLIEDLPKVSQIKVHLESGGKLKDIEAPAGSIGVLRWVIGSCRAYLKETKPGEGIVNEKSMSFSYGVSSADIKQFTFVLGSPEQEHVFRGEIAEWQAKDSNCRDYPTLLAFHGSSTERWHNILRTGLDYTDVAFGRAYGNGVYFASEVTTSMSGYSRAAGAPRSNADYPLERATAVVELGMWVNCMKLLTTVNVPNTFVSRNPFYVVSNTKQIKPFLLLVQAQPTVAPAVIQEQAIKQLEAKGKKSVAKASSEGELFQHDPELKMPTTYFGSRLQALTRITYVDDDSDDEQDAAIFRGVANPAVTMISFKPSAASRLQRLQLMPPPTDTSITASKALGKEFKALLKLQNEGALPFYLDPNTDSLYCWTLELFDFADSQLKTDMTQFKIPSIVAEIRFPSTFPHSPPFMRILHPRCLPFNQGGGGNITAGGSVCNEILTATGWNPAFCIEAIVRDIMTNMTEATPPARLDPRRWDQPYALTEAVEAYKRVALGHGWEVPKDFERLTT